MAPFTIPADLIELATAVGIADPVRYLRQQIGIDGQAQSLPRISLTLGTRLAEKIARRTAEMVELAAQESSSTAEQNCRRLSALTQELLRTLRTIAAERQAEEGQG